MTARSNGRDARPSSLVARMLNPRGYVNFQRGRFVTNRVPFVRWTTAPAFRALAGLELHGADAMRVWIDLANSPHVPLFVPVVRALEERGDEVVLTARDHAQTLPLAVEVWPEVVVIGGESPAGRVRKGVSILSRSAGLWRFAVGAVRTWRSRTAPTRRSSPRDSPVCRP